MMKIAIFALLVTATSAFAQTPSPKTFTLSAPLVEELFQRLSTTGLVTMLQSEIQHQPPPVTCPPAQPESKPAPAAPPDNVKRGD